MKKIFSVKNENGHNTITICGVKFNFKTQQFNRNKMMHNLKFQLEDLNYRIKNQALINSTNLIYKNKNAKILVLLHLFYMDSWDYIKSYLDNLSYYNYDLIVTCTNGYYDNVTLDKIKAYKTNTQFYFYDNKGYDIGPFIDILNKINLDNYDVVYKLHSKGVNRRYIYIYHQIFKNDDWFKNLYEGICGISSTHYVIDKIMHDASISYIAASNLIIKDPEYKQRFVIDIAKKNNITVCKNYDFVAGSIWACAATNLKVLQKLNLSIDDFEDTKRGEFTFAHAMERISNVLLANENKKPYGIFVYYNKYEDELNIKEKYNSERLLVDSSFKIDYEFFYRVLEGISVYNYEIVEIPLKNIKRLWNKKAIPLEKCHAFKYLNGEIKVYQEYCKVNSEIYNFDMSVEKFDNLIAAFENGTFDYAYYPIINEKNIIMDGQHRCCYWLKKYGKNHKIKVLKLQTKR